MTQNNQTIEEVLKEFDEKLESWLESDEHRLECCSWGEGQYCCLDKDNEDRPHGRPFIKSFIQEKLQQAYENGYTDGLNIRKNYNDPELLKEIAQQEREKNKKIVRLLIDDVESGFYGTKNRAELLLILDRLK